MHKLNYLLFVLLWVLYPTTHAIAQIIPPPQISRDTPTEAQEVSIGACDINFPLDAAFNNSAVGNTTPCTGTAVGTIQEDAWAKFTTPATGGNFVIRYTATDGDAVVLVYDDNANSPNNLVGCINNVSGAGVESLEINLTANTVYWVRVANMGLFEGMNGSLCLFRQYSSDDQTTAASVPTLPLGACNIQFELNGSDSGFGDVTTGCTTIQPSVNGNRDGWVRFDATNGQNIAVEYQSNSNANFPGIVVYYDNSGTLNQIDCYDGGANASTYAKVDFSATNTGTYYIRVLNMANTNAMEGSLCVYENSVKAHDNCADAEANKLVNGDCNVQFNVYGSKFSQNLGNPTITCASPPGIPAEAWAAFDGIQNNTYTILYNNNNNDASEAIDVAVVIYRKNGGACAAPAAFTEVFCRNKEGEGVEEIEFTAPANDVYYIRIVNISNPTNSNTVFGTLCFYEGSKVSDDLCTSSSTIGVGTCGQAFNITDKFINNEARLAPTVCSGTSITSTTTSYRDGWKNFVALSGRTRIEYKETAGQDAVLEVYTGDCNALGLLACANAVGGNGSEVIEINTNVSQVYFIRVINITNSADMTGEICVTNVLVDDVCSGTAVSEISVGACNQRVDILSTFDTGGGNASGFGTSCGGGVTIAKDVWFKFTGNGGNVTLQYENLEATSNPLLEIYTSGSTNCPSGTGTAVGCSNDCNTASIQTETVTINNTLNGRTYFVRIANLNETQMTGLLCLYNSSAFPPATVTNRLPTNTCTTANSVEVGDCGLRINLPVSTSCTSSPSHFTNSGVALGGTCAALTPTNDGWLKFTAVATQEYTIEFDNNNQLVSPSNDIALAVYDGSSVACGSLSATELIACGNNLTGTKGIEKLTFTAPNSGEVFIRIMNVSGNATGSYGKFCLYSGDSKAADECTSATVFNVGDLDQQFNIQNTFKLDSPPSAGVPNCVFTSGSNRAQKDGWAQFTTGASQDTISVVYNNDDGDAVIELDPDVNNAAVVVYEGSPCGSSNPVIVGCANVVGEGSESLTFAAKPSTTYYVRVISTRFSSTMQGRLSIFAFKKCDLGVEQVRDGDFTNFPKNSIDLGTVFAHSATNLEAAQRKHVFATEYGYRQHTGRRNEMGGPSHYGVATSARRLFGAFHAYGYRYNGWGGRNNAYCSNGGQGVGTEACPKTAPPPESNFDANLLVVDGVNKRSKIWCQTVPMPAGTNRYFVFSGWFNSLIPSDRSNLDDPQIRITVCEGKGLYDPSMSTSANDAAGNLPGVTLTYNQANSTGLYTINAEEQTVNVMHRPIHPGIRGGSRGRPNGTYGAAVSCNPANLKVINSDVFLPEAPDNWQAMQCIYKVPDDVTHVNLCLENISATRVGNDFGIDVLSFRQCLNGATIGSDLERVSCELGTDPTILGIPLNVQMVHFDGKLKGKNVFLEWVVSSESNVRVYEVQRATSGGKFETIGKVTARGSAGKPTIYNFVDNNLPLHEDYVYYRLNVVNMDNVHGYSPLVTIKIKQINDLKMTLSPNPVAKGSVTQLTFETAQAGQAAVYLVNTMGRIVRQQSVSVAKGANRVNIATENLSAGIYIVKLVSGGIQQTKKLLVSQ